MAKKKQEDNKPLDVLAEYDINLQQEMFCQYFTSPTEFFGNGVQSYSSAYNFDINNPRDYNTAKSAAARLLTNVNVLNRINSLLDADGFNDTNVDKQLLMLISQSADFHAKLGAIKEYNKLKTRITDKVEHAFSSPIATIEIVPVDAEAVKKQREDIRKIARGEELEEETDDEVEGS